MRVTFPTSEGRKRLTLRTTFGDAGNEIGDCIVFVFLERLASGGGFARMKPILRLSLDTVNMIAAGEVIQVRSRVWLECASDDRMA